MVTCGMKIFALVGFAVILAVSPVVVHAVETLPVIVSYEAMRRQSLDQLAARDPKAFWVGQIVARIEDKKPLDQPALPAPVVVKIHFVVGRDGHLVDRSVKDTSGVPAIDATAMAMLDRAQPFPPMPTVLDGTEMAFNVPIRFR